jgi:hypothetical protein
LVAVEKCATLKELEHWTLEEVYKANAMLDIKNDIEKVTYANIARSTD